MSYLVTGCDVIGFIATFSALVFVIRGWKAPLARDVKTILALMISMNVLRNIANVVEWSDITLQYEPFEDYLEILLPMFWAFAFYVLLLDRDREERVELNRSLALKNKELQSVVYVASHDLRSPLVNIRGFSHELAASCARLAELLHEPHPSEETRGQIRAILNQELPEALKFIDAGAESMDRIIEGLLKLSRAGTEELEMRSLDMNRLLLGLRQAASFQIEQKNVAFTLGDLPPCRADENQIAQVFSNLIDNALKYLDESRPGRISVTGWQERERAVYCVKDNGIGIAPADHEKAFKVFCRLHPDKTGPGEGLGLNIVAKILERHSGSIRLESQPGQGAAFYITLPRA